MNSSKENLAPTPAQAVATGLVRERRRDELLRLVYEDLRRLAGSYLGRERAGHTLSATDLVHEAYGRLVDQTRVDWQGRSHFFAVSAQAMRRVLIDHARRHTRLKHGGEWQRVTLDPGLAAKDRLEVELEELIQLDRALTKLAEIDPRQAQVVEMRYFAGMSVPEVAEALGISPRSVDRDWTHAKSWLKRELSENNEPA